MEIIFVIQDVISLYSSVVERQSCKLKVLGSIPSGGFFLSFMTSFHVRFQEARASAYSFAAVINPNALVPNHTLPQPHPHALLLEAFFFAEV